MPLQDVSNDQTMISWLRQAGHAHLLDEQLRNTNTTSSPPPLNALFGQASSSSNFSPSPSNYPPATISSSSYPPATTSSSNYPPQTTSSSNYPPQTTSLSSPPPIFGGGYSGADALINTLGRSASMPQTDFYPTANYGGLTGSPSPPLIPPTIHFNAPPYDHQSSPSHFISSPTQFLAPNMDQRQLDMDIENMKRDPNTRVVQRPPQDDVVYKQRVFVRYLQPPTPPVGGTIIVREKQPPGPPPDPPIVIKRAAPPPPTPPPVYIRERPPPIPPPEGTTVIDKIIPPGPKPPRQVVIEQYPPLPPKPQDVIIERWLPVPPRQRRILYERLPPSMQQAARPIIVQYGPPHVRIQREVITAPGAQLPYQQVAGRPDINQIVSQMGGHPQMHSSFPSSSLISYNPFTNIQPSYGTVGQSQPNIVIMQNGQPSTITPSSYGIPLTCVCTPNQAVGLGAYGSGLSTIPMMGQSAGQSMVYNIPENIPIDNVLRQLGIDPHTIQRSTGIPPTDPHNAIAHVWNAASHANLPHTSDPHNAIAHVWNAASHANPPHTSEPGSAVSHVWNAAAHAADHAQTGSAVSHVWNAALHASDQAQSGSPTAGRVWDRIEHYLHPQSGDAVPSAWSHIPHQGSQPPQSSPMNYPPPPLNYSPPQGNYPPPPGNYPPPQGNYPPPQGNYPPPQGNYPPSHPNYPPPPSNYPQPPPNYPPPPSGNYPPAPPSGGQGSAGASVLSRLFGGGR